MAAYYFQAQVRGLTRGKIASRRRLEQKEGFIGVYTRTRAAAKAAAVDRRSGEKRESQRSVWFRLPERLMLILTVLMTLSLPKILPDVDASAGSPVSRLLWTLLYIIAIVGIVAELKTALRLLRASLPLVLLVLVAVGSTFWSETPLITAKESLGLVGTSLIALFFACRLSLVAFIETICIALVISALSSAALIAFVPDLGRQAEMNGLWEGATVHKNILGIAMVQALVTMACIMDRSQGLLRRLQIAAMVLFAVLLIGSGSVSSMVVAAMLFFTFFLLRRSRATGSAKSAVITLAVAAAGAFGALLSGFDIDQIFGALGKDPTLSGRTELWQFALDAIDLRPILGYGYDVFFNPATPTGEAAIRGLDWDVNIYMAHNGFLEATLGLGLVGLALVVAVLIIGFRRTAIMFWQGRDLASLWPLLTVIYTLFSNITEAGIARVNDVNWIIFIVAFLFATDAMQQRAASASTKPRRRFA